MAYMYTRKAGLSHAVYAILGGIDDHLLSTSVMLKEADMPI